MNVVFERRASPSAKWARRLAIFSAVLLLTATAGHRFAFVDTIPFFWLLGIVMALAIAALVLAGIGFSRLWAYGDRGGRASTRAVIVAVLVLTPFAFGGYRVFALPRLTDVSTDPFDPPAFALAHATRRAGMNRIGTFSSENAELQLSYYPSATGRRYPLLVDRAHEIVGAVLENLDWQVTSHPQLQLEVHETTIEAVARSPIFGFVSDVAIRVIDEGDTSYIDVRSVSRYGMHDLGDNAAKIARFFEAVEAQILAVNAPVVQTE
jgi:uncharacterized protein (DUF1499 family)